MKSNTRVNLRPRLLVTATLAAALTACGGGGDAPATLDAGVAQGNAADAVAMPVHATDSLDSAVAALESQMAAAAASGSHREQPLAVATAVSASAACANGGTVAWSVTGGTPESQLNGQLDAGETFDVSYTACGAADGGPVLDGSLTLAVAQRSASASDVTLTATALKATWAVGGNSTLNGSARRQHSVVATAAGGSQHTSQVTSSGITLASTIGARQANYELNSLSWTIVRTFDASGAYVGRTHEGALDLAASTPRRPNATLQVSTQGASSIGSDGWVSQGGFVIVTGRNKIACTHAGGTVTLTLDLGNDGSVDRTWALTRAAFQSEAG
jgi:hypothetical protein